MRTELTATRTKIAEILAIREDLRDQTILAAEYRRLTDREDALLLAIRAATPVADIGTARHS